MALPYSNATSGKNAMSEINKILKGFGATSVGHMENFDKGEVLVQFEHRGRRVSVVASSTGYATAWLKETPYSSRMRSTKIEYERKALGLGQVAVYSILRDWIKGQVTAIECGILSFEGAFLGQIHLPTGETVLQRITETGILSLPAPEPQ